MTRLAFLPCAPLSTATSHIAHVQSHPSTPSTARRAPYARLPSDASDAGSNESGRNVDWREFRARLVQTELSTNSHMSCLTPVVNDAENIDTDDSSSLSESTTWAHAVSFLERGSILIASPQHFGEGQNRSFFADTVVLLLEHCSTAGSLGIVLNRPVVGNVDAARARVKRQMGGEVDEDILAEITALSTGPVCLGGPVGLESVIILHGEKNVGGELTNGVGTIGLEQGMKRLKEGRLSSGKFFCGYAGWHPGQLEMEVNNGVWMMCACSSDVVLREWRAGREGVRDVLRLMGGRYAQLADSESSHDVYG